MDYSSSLLQALRHAECKTSFWNKPSIDHALNAVTELSKRSAIPAKNALLISTLFPVAFTFASTPLLELGAKEAGAGPAATDLAPFITQGLQSWYWNLTNFTDSSGLHISGVLFVIKQTTINAQTGLSVWSIDAGAVDPATGKWVSPETVYLDSNMVNVVQNGVNFSSSKISGNVAATATGFSIAVNFVSGFSFQVSSTSVRGPTYEQSSGNVKRIGPMQNGYWSIVDGSVTTGSLQCAATTTLNIFNSGMSWLDYQQFGFAGISHLEQLLACAFKAPSNPVQWMFLVIQTPEFQIDAYILNLGTKSLTSTLGAMKRVKSTKTVNYWGNAKVAAYDLNCEVEVLSVYPTTGGVSGVPSKVALTISNIIYTLTSICTTIPSLITAGGSGYESPSTVTWTDASGNSQSGTGVIEWVPGNMYPTKTDVLMETGISSKILKSADPNPNASAFVAFFIIFVVFFLASVITVPICLSRLK